MDLTQLPAVFNATSHFVDRHLTEGRAKKIAIECGDEKVTYSQLAERVNRAGNALKSLGVHREQRVALLLLDTPDFAYCFFGAIKIGAVAVPLNTLLTASDYEYLLNDSRTEVVIVSAPLLSRLQAIPSEHLQYLKTIVVAGDVLPGFASLGSLMNASSAELKSESTCKDDAAFWLYSSGSTGKPKGCVHLQHDMVVSAESYGKAVLGVRETDRLFSVAKLFFAYGLGNGLYFSLAVGATSILWPGTPSPANVIAVIERYRPTLFFSVPSNYAALLSYRANGQERELDFSSVRWAVSAGESLPESIYQRFAKNFGVQILDAIGSTEALHMFIANRPGANRPGSSGQVIPGFEARILNESGQPVPDGEIGNLFIKGDSICSHYWNQHERSKDTIQGHWLRTGDKYYRDQDGYYFYVGRSDEMLKVKGMWVSPIEIENALLDHPAVQEAAVVGFADDDDLTKPAAFVAVRSGFDESEQLSQSLMAFLKQRLAPHKCPHKLEFVKELPRTATGKVQRYKLREQMQKAPASGVGFSRAH
ncbi:MAG TPA: benzoate-CoA ligase family protein [Terriglobales bacterium]|nr:benzoate-CoA ligase family protein [Terriglobales bacterium]